MVLKFHSAESFCPSDPNREEDLESYTRRLNTDMTLVSHLCENRQEMKIDLSPVSFNKGVVYILSDNKDAVESEAITQFLT